MEQIWHFDHELVDLIRINAVDIDGKTLIKQVTDGWYSSYYGIKEATSYWIFSSDKRKITTEIEIVG